MRRSCWMYRRVYRGKTCKKEICKSFTEQKNKGDVLPESPFFIRRNMPVDWKKYSKNWKEVARQKKESVGWRCEECGKQCRKPGEEFDTHSRTLTVHHIDMDPMNNDPENLIALCAGCHLKRHRKVKSLDKVIELAEHCLKPMGQNLCSTCPGRYANRCNVWEDSLHYLKEYQNKKHLFGKGK